MADRERLEFRVSREWLDRLDGLRGGVPRGTFVKRLVEEASETPNTGPARADLPATPAPPEPALVPPTAEIPLPKIAPRRSY